MTVIDWWRGLQRWPMLFPKQRASKGGKKHANVLLGIWPIGKFTDSVDLKRMDVISLKASMTNKWSFHCHDAVVTHFSHLFWPEMSPNFSLWSFKHLSSGSVRKWSKYDSILTTSKWLRPQERRVSLSGKNLWWTPVSCCHAGHFQGAPPDFHRVMRA